MATLMLIAALVASFFLSCNSVVPILPHHLIWYNVSQALTRGALCNDFSIAGYFIRKNPISKPPSLDTESEMGSTLDLEWNSTKPDYQNRKKWVIFLEGGGGCTSPKSCNERFITQNIRDDFTVTENGSKTVNAVRAWMEYRNRPLVVTSKLMTSIWRFSGIKTPGLYKGNSSFPNLWTIKGKDILSTSQSENPDFYHHNHVLIPYCSSDLWLKNTRNYQRVFEENFSFQFDPTSDSYHQFTFRGVSIFRSIISDLFEFHGLSSAEEVILAGSSAGGIGSMNHAKWLQGELRTHSGSKARLYVILDSAWFIDFRGEIMNQFAPDEIQALAATNEILDTCSLINSTPNALSRTSAITCFSAPLFLATDKFPLDVPVLAVFSRYDLYLLAQALATEESDNGLDILELMRIVSEYSGSMNSSLQSTTVIMNSLSYFVTSCFQHVYLATSSLWGEGALFGMAVEDGSIVNNKFKHVITSGIWDTFHLQHLNHTSSMTTPISLLQAIHMWLENARKSPQKVVKLQDVCDGPYCNLQCPEMVVLGEILPYWSIPYQWVILLVIVSITLVGMSTKVVLSVGDIYVSTKQNKFLIESSSNYQESESALPYCPDTKAISIACLDLK